MHAILIFLELNFHSNVYASISNPPFVNEWHKLFFNVFLLSKTNTKHWYIQSVHEYIDSLEKDIEV